MDENDFIRMLIDEIPGIDSRPHTLECQSEDLTLHRMVNGWFQLKKEGAVNSMDFRENELEQLRRMLNERRLSGGEDDE